MANQPESSDPKGTKCDFSTAILERKKARNRLVVDEAVNDDNSVVTLHPETMEKLQLFRGGTILIKFAECVVVPSETLTTETRMEEATTSKTKCVKKRKTSKKNNGGGGGIDRLSTLEDKLLLRILSYLDTKTCVNRISLVSRRYRDLWKHLPVLDFDFYNDDYDYQKFSRFVTSVFVSREVRDVWKLRLSCGFSQFNKFSIYDIDVWVRCAIGPHLKELDLSLFAVFPNQEYLFNFTYSVFKFCPDLVSLSLSGDIKLNCSTVCLPLLKKLIIRVSVFEDVLFLDKLLFGCPILEILEVSIYTSSLTKLCVPHSLKRLKFINKNKSAVGPCLEIDAPGLKYLGLSRNTFKASNIVNLHMVDETNLDLYGF